MCAGTIVRSATGTSSCVVFTAEQLGDLLDIDKAHNANSVLLVANGDGVLKAHTSKVVPIKMIIGMRYLMPRRVAHLGLII